MLLTITNLYPRPDQPRRGLFNAHLFDALARRPGARLVNLCLVPEWRPWRHPAIRQWTDPRQPDFETRYLPVFYLPLIGRNLSAAFHRRALAEHAALFRDCDAVLAAWLYPDGVAAARMAACFGKPCAVKVHGTDVKHLYHPLRGPLIRSALANVDLLPNCRFLANRLEQAGIERRRIRIVPNGIDGCLFRYRSANEALAELEGK